MDGEQVSELKQCLEDRGLPSTGLKPELAARLKAADKCDTRANGVGGGAIPAGAAANAGDLGAGTEGGSHSHSLSLGVKKSDADTAALLQELEIFHIESKPQPFTRKVSLVN